MLIYSKDRNIELAYVPRKIVELTLLDSPELRFGARKRSRATKEGRLAPGTDLMKTKYRLSQPM